MSITPGPWKCDYPQSAEDYFTPIYVENDDGELVCKVPNGHNEDAALIAAVKELLAACKAIVKDALDDDGCRWCDRSKNWPHEDWCPIPSTIDAIDEAEVSQ